MPCQDECLLIEASDVPVLLFTDSPTLLQAVDTPTLLLDGNPRTTLLQFLDPAPLILIDNSGASSGGGGGTGSGVCCEPLTFNDDLVWWNHDLVMIGVP